MAKPATVLASLVAAGVIECQVAWVGSSAGGRPRRLFHDKVGILSDGSGASVVFKGSMNETWPGLALDGNLESVDVYVSWGGDRERERIDDERDYFKRLWSGKFPGVEIRPLPEAALAEIVSAADAAHWPEFVDEICFELDQAARWSPIEGESRGRVPRPHQTQALDAWRDKGRRGILEHATGSGKTFTALCAIGDALRSDEIPLILVPSDLLLSQWERELRSAFGEPNLQLLVCGGGNAAWRDSARLRQWTRRPVFGQRPRAVLATIQTASTPEFVALCSAGSHLFVVADEVHRLGATRARSILNLDSGARLGLSATPRRAGDPVGTAAVLKYFEGVVPPPFTIQDAIHNGTLTPYAYHVHPVHLEDEEQERWDKITADLRRMHARAQSQHSASQSDSDLEVHIKRLLIQRARIVKSAHQKVRTAAKVVKDHWGTGQHWIVYCDDQTQLALVRDDLRRLKAADVYEYHTAMAGDPSRTLSVFEAKGGIVVSIRCLDEGVDIPAVSHALILASSRNPREFIQRRGRVLRRYPGKALAHIHDVLVAPQIDGNEPPGLSILEGEISRAIEFGANAINPGCVADLRRLAAEHGLDWAAAARGGYEDDDDDESGEQVHG
jgi:superfamily II DNA or RNA helicase